MHSSAYCWVLHPLPTLEPTYMGEGVPIPSLGREYLYLHGRGSTYTYMGEGVPIPTLGSTYTFIGEGVLIPTWERECLYLHGRGSTYTYMGEGVSIPTWEREYLYLHGRGSTWVREYLYRLGEGLPIHNLVFVGKSIASRVTAIAQWICLHLPCCHPWFEYHLCFYHLKSKLCYICLCIVKRTKINKKWSILKRPLQVPNISYKKWLHSKWQIPVFACYKTIELIFPEWTDRFKISDYNLSSLSGEWLRSKRSNVQKICNLSKSLKGAFQISFANLRQVSKPVWRML